MAILTWTDNFHMHISDEGHLSVKHHDFMCCKTLSVESFNKSTGMLPINMADNYQKSKSKMFWK